MKIEEWLGEQNTLGIDIWKRKYQYEGESFDAWLDRVSGGDEDVLLPAQRRRGPGRGLRRV